MNRRFGSLETPFWEPLDGSAHLETVFRVLLFGNFWKTRVLQKSSVSLGKTSIFEDLGTSAAVKLTMERRFQRPLDVKLALERRFRAPFGVLGALKRRFGGPETAFWGLWTVSGAGISKEREGSRTKVHPKL